MSFMHSDCFKNIILHLIPKHALTTFGGWLANMKTPMIKDYLINYFIRKYDVNLQEALESNPKQYANFNDFFIRHLKPTCRPVATAAIVSPVDGCISEIGPITKGQLLQAKGHHYSVHELLATDKKISALFEEGSFATLYLSPKDYHRVHMPMDATLQHMRYVPGKLFSVQPATTRNIPRLFARNERLVVFFDTSVGPMVMVLVGATIVGAIGTSWHGDMPRAKNMSAFDYTSPNKEAQITLRQAEEMGYFKLGSTVILLFANRAHMQWKTDLCQGKSIRFGEALGEIV